MKRVTALVLALSCVMLLSSCLMTDEKRRQYDIENNMFICMKRAEGNEVIFDKCVELTVKPYQKGE